MIGQIVSHYQIEEKLGEGGMGVVYRAEDLRIKRPVALKFLPPHLVADLRAKDRFLIEAQAASALDHPNICVIYEIDETEDGELFIAMAYYDGETLAEKLQRGPLPIPDVIEIARQVALGSSKAHERGIVHRDIKPANLMVTEDGIWKILDFGIAKLSGAAHLTRTGRAVGTVAYMSPEQAERDEASAQSDIWSLGVVFYEMLAGCLPFHGATPVATLFQILYEEPDSLAEARDEVPPELDRIVSRALAKDLGVRYGSMAELLEDLEPLSGAATKPPIPTGDALQPERAPKGLTATPPPFLTPSGEPSHEAALLRFAGRETELAVLDGWFQEALAGQGRVGFITGEAGTGKTALVREFCRRSAESHDDLIAATGECDAHTGPGDPHHPFREILGLLTGDVEAQWAAGSLSADHATRLWSFLPSTVRALVESGPDLVGTLIPDAGLMSRADTHPTLEQSWRGRLQGIVERRRSGIQQTDLIDQLVRVLWTLARERPFLLVVDDLQWADAGTMGTLFQLGKRLAGSRILLIGLYRPSEVALGQDGQRHPLESVVHELSGRFGEVVLEVGATGHRPFVDALVDAEPNLLGSSFRKALFSQTQGHALFTVELLRSLREQGMLVQNAQGEWQEGAAPIDWNRLPARVDAIIGERLDRLPANLRRLLTIAAVEGAEFTLEAAAMVQDVGIRELIGPVSMELEKRHRLISTHGLRRLNGQKLSVYRFRHILFQRHLYHELSEVERVHLHEQVGEALETLYGDHKDEIAPQLARHFREAGLTEKAFAYSEMAGIQVRRVGSMPEAVGHLQAALDALLSLPPGEERSRRELELQLELGLALYWANPALGQDASSRAYELARRIGSREQLFWTIQTQYWFRSFHFDHRLGRRLVEEGLSIAREDGHEGLLPYALDTVGRNALLRGDFASALEHYEELVSVYDPQKHRSERYAGIGEIDTVAFSNLGVILWLLGYPDQALARGEAAVTAGRTQRSPVGLINYNLFLGLPYMWRGDIQASLGEFQAAKDRAGEVGLSPYFDPYLDVFIGWDQAIQGEVAKGVELARRGVTAQEALGAKTWLPWYVALLADALRLGGRAEEGLRLLDEAHAGVEIIEDLTHESEILRIKGTLYLALPDPNPAEAEASFRQAIAVAKGQEARSYELRATTSLARLLRDTDRSEEAREMLAEIYGWFTEGFGTADLKEAKALLEQLGGSP